MRKLTLSVSSATGALMAASLVALAPITAYSQQLEEITVTARKTSESLQEVPLAITAIGAEEIDRLGIKDLSGITNQDTSVQFDEGFTPSDTRITIRGLSPTRGRPNAATLVDGIDVTSEAVSNAGGSLLINPRLIDIERIEIVKGPQSALYGRSAFGGAIQYVTKDPADVLSGEAWVEANTEDQQEVRGNVSIPINDNLGMLINGSAWNAQGIHENSATNSDVGGGDGVGGSITFKWEPSDELSFKWRTEYSDDHFDVAPQVLLNGRNKFYDLGEDGELDSLMGANNPLNGGSNLIPGNISSSCTGGPLDNYGCNESFNLREFFENPGPDSRGNAKDLGQYDGSDAWRFNQYNKQVVSAYVGKFPDGDDLDVALMPNYSTGKGAFNPMTGEGDPSIAGDYDGIDKDVFRTSLVSEWAYSDELTFTSYTSYLNSTVWEQLDIGKYFVDEGSPDSSLLDDDYLQYLNDQNLPVDAYSPINAALGPDGIHDGSIGFVQDSKTETEQFSQEIRGSWEVDYGVVSNLTSGLLYWYEDLTQKSKNTVSMVGGPECYGVYGDNTGVGFDASQDPITAPFLGVGALRDQCGYSSLGAAYWLGATRAGREVSPDDTDRTVTHWSWYGSMDLDLTDKLSARLEARFTREKNEVTGLVQNPCLDSTATLDTASGNCFRADGSPADPPGAGAGGQPTGPSAAIICGQVGRCDRLAYATPPYGPTHPQQPGYPSTPAQAGTNSWWNWGYSPMPGTKTDIEKTDRFWAPKATLEYFWNEDLMTYFSWSRGIKPGGFSLLTSGAFGLDANLDGNYDEIDYGNERLDVWELGYKSTLFDGSVRVNGSFFYQDFKDKQVTVQAVVANTVGTKVENISGSEIYGIELEGTWQVTDNLRAGGGWTYLQSEYTDYEVFTTSANDIARVQLGNGKGCTRIADPVADGGLEGCLASFNGNDLERVPKHALIANLNYTNNLLDTGYEWFTETSWRYQDSRYVEAFNIVEFPSYNTTDLRAGILADGWDLTFFLDNVFDDDTIKTGGPNPGLPTGDFGFGLVPSPFPGVVAGPRLPSDIYAQLPNPRIAGVRVKILFGE